MIVINLVIVLKVVKTIVGNSVGKSFLIVCQYQLKIRNVHLFKILEIFRRFQKYDEILGLFRTF